MVGSTPIDIRKHINGLATEDDQYCLGCGRTGDRPVPAVSARFSDQATARATARATEQYRSVLRRYDTQVPYCDLIICELPPRDTTAAHTRESETDSLSNSVSRPILTGSATPERRDLVNFCHHVAGTVLETLSEAGYDGVESGVMDAYFEHTELEGDPDELCLCLLESMASKLHERLTSTDQTEILTAAAARLESPSDNDSALNASVVALEQRGLIESYMGSSYSVDSDGGARPVVVQISGYTRSAHDGRLPVLPLTLDLCRHRTEQPSQSVRVSAVDGGRKLTFGLPDTGGHNSIVSAPIDGRV